MLGHQLWISLSERNQVTGTLRNPHPKLEKLQNANRKLVVGIEASGEEDLRKLIAEENFDIIINCVGVIKQLDLVKEAVPTIFTNSLFPHMLASWTGKAKLIQVSTDCVFSGKKGNYSEEDVPDAKDLYGKSKLLGEVDYGNHLTLRTSIVGHELTHSVSLFDWFLEQKTKVKGYTRAIYSGLTTLELAKQIDNLMVRFPNLNGLYQISSKPIDKFTLLNKLAKVYNQEIEIEPFSDFETDKSLNFSALHKETGYSPSSWDQQLEELHQHYKLYKDSLYTKN